jgi:glutamate racemase
MSTHLRVGVFDSGVGGLSVVHAMRQLLPQLDILYVADSAHAPYGSKPAAFVRERAQRITTFLIEQGAQAIVVACNTATAVAVEDLRASFSLPIVAMEPAVKPATAATLSGVIGVLATAGTLESERYRQLVDSHGQRVEVLARVCHDWVALVEAGELDSAPAQQAVAAEVAPLLAAGADTLVLGCTHFPFLAPLIARVAGPQVSVIDPAPAVAEQLARRLEGRVAGEGRMRLWSSRDAVDESLRISRLLGATVAVESLPETPDRPGQG